LNIRNVNTKNTYNWASVILVIIGDISLLKSHQRAA